PGRDVDQRNLMPPARVVYQRFAVRHHSRMQAQLQHGADAAAVLAFDFLQRIQVPRVDDDWLFANRMRAGAQRQADVRVVQIVRRTNADVMHPLGFRPAGKLFEMAIETFDLGKKAHAERVAIEQADSIMRIHGGDQPLAGVADRIQVARRNESSYAGNGKVLRQRCSPETWTHASDARVRARAAPITAATRGPCPRTEKGASNGARPAAPLRRRRFASPMSALSLWRHSSGVDARKPFTPSCTISRLTPTADATTGTPHDMN